MSGLKLKNQNRDQHPLKPFVLATRTNYGQMVVCRLQGHGFSLVCAIMLLAKTRQLHFAGVVETKVLDLWFTLLSSFNLYFICLRKNLHPTRLQMQITTFVLSVGTR